MQRLILVATVALGLVVGGWVVVQSGPTAGVAQDRTEERLGVLETAVVEQDEEISGLRNRVRRLEEAVLTPQVSTGEAPASSDARGPEGTTFSGRGEMASDPFAVEPGTYEIFASCPGEDAFIVVSLLNIDSGLGGVLLTGESPYEGTMLQTLNGGRYAWSVSGDCDWLVSLTPAQ